MQCMKSVCVIKTRGKKTIKSEGAERFMKAASEKYKSLGEQERESMDDDSTSVCSIGGISLQRSSCWYSH